MLWSILPDTIPVTQFPLPPGLNLPYEEVLNLSLIVLAHLFPLHPVSYHLRTTIKYLSKNENI